MVTFDYNNLNNYITNLRREIDVMDLNWKGNCANVIKSGLKQLISYESDSSGRNCSLQNIRKQLIALENLFSQKEVVKSKLKACAVAEDNWNYTVDRARENSLERENMTFEFNALNTAKENLNNEWVKLNKYATEILHLSSESLGRGLNEETEYKIKTEKVTGSIIELLNGLYEVLLVLYTQVDSYSGEGTTETLSAKGNHMRARTFSKTFNSSTPIKKVLSNLEKIINKVDKLRIKITDHLNNIIQLENGESFEIAGTTEAAEEKIPIVQEEKYTVQAGDSLASIGSKYDKSWEEIYEANKSVVGDNPNAIYSGMNLTIPGVSTTTSDEPKETVNNSLGDVKINKDYKPIGTYDELVK